jgi:hypothetical protein
MYNIQFYVLQKLVDMEVVASIFNTKARCPICAKKFNLTSKRRKCHICSKLYLGKVFCRRCSIKTQHPTLGFLRPKRYCKPCYEKLNTPASIDSEAAPEGHTEEIKEAAREVPSEWKPALESAGLTSEEIRNHPDEIFGTIVFMTEGLPMLPSRADFDQAFKESVVILTTDPRQEYRLTSKLGEGGAGAVYLVENINTSQKYALKKIKPKNPKQRNQIFNEIALMELSRHPNVLEYYSSYEFDG